MNTHAYLVLLLAIGLSALKSEFEIDFENMVKTVQLKDNKTLLNCTENCIEVEEKACKCLNFDHCLSSTIFECFKQGLGRLNFESDSIARIHKRLQYLQLRLPTPGPRDDRDEWNKPMSPKRFLIKIQTLAEELTTLNSSSV